MISEAALARLRRRAHVHTDACWGRGDDCVEHHCHDATCVSKTLVCRQAEDVDLVALLAAYDNRGEQLAVQFGLASAEKPEKKIVVAPSEPFPPNTALGRRVGIDR